MNTILVIAAVLMMGSPLSYLYKVSKKQLTPSILSWYGWAVLIGISVVSQVIAGGWSSNLITILLSSVSCFVIAFCANYVFKNFSVNRKDLIYVYSGSACVLIYILFNNQWLTTSLAITADFLLALPTLKMAYKNPKKEKSFSWPLALVAWALTISVLFYKFSWINALWPLYLILFNGTMTYFTFCRQANNQAIMEAATVSFDNK
jgi:hypothetical protein